MSRALLTEGLDYTVLPKGKPFFQGFLSYSQKNSLKKLPPRRSLGSVLSTYIPINTMITTSDKLLLSVSLYLLYKENIYEYEYKCAASVIISGLN